MNLPVIAKKTVNRPTISLALISKNEEKNIRRLLDSVAGCFDEIVLVDTGSFDKTRDIAAELDCKVYDFQWVESFSKARNFAFSKCTSDYIMWLDCDDVLYNREGFIQWRNTAMQYAECFFATYHYALDGNKKSEKWPDGEPVCSFVRERVFKRSLNPTWQYDLHEGIILKPEWQKDYAITWAVNHLRDQEDMKQDKSRNLRILEGMKDKLDGRLQFYYGKELYEGGRPSDAVKEFQKAIDRTDLERHDRLLAYQYAAYSAQACADQLKDEAIDEKRRYYDQAAKFAREGLGLDPGRAEFHVVLGDLALKQNNLVAAVPCYAAAKACINQKAMGSPYEGAIYSFLDCYGLLPSIQLSKIYFHMGMMDMAEKEAIECYEKYKNTDAKAILDEIKRIKPLITVENNQVKTDEIVFTCPPQSAYPFDEKIYQEKPLGGSETALVQMAKEIRKQTGRTVKVFNMREDDLRADSGVEYISSKKVNEYFSKFKPHAHIAWRHNIKITNAKTYLWAHDLFTPTVEAVQNFDKMLCLSEFHRDLTMGKCGVPKEKIIVTRNGITPEKFNFERPKKNPNKFVYMSSPDRGLYGAILVVDEVRKVFPDTELHVYYGLENLRKYGLNELADKIDALLPSRPWVKVHGFVEQNRMYREVADASIWIHPATFLETYCITALEMLALGIYPVTRRLAGLGNTLADAELKGQATLLESNNLTHYITPAEIQQYSAACISAVQQKKWEKVSLDLEKNSWREVASQWVKFMEL